MRSAIRIYRRGVALVGALGAVVVVGALIISMFFTSSIRGKIGNAALAHTRALAAVDHGENETLLAIADVSVDSLAIGASSPAAMRSVPGGGTNSSSVTRLQHNLFLLVTEGSAGSPGSAGLTLRTGLLFRMVIVPADSADSTAAPPVATRVTQRAWMHFY